MIDCIIYEYILSVKPLTENLFQNNAFCVNVSKILLHFHRLKTWPSRPKRQWLSPRSFYIYLLGNPIVNMLSKPLNALFSLRPIVFDILSRSLRAALGNGLLVIPRTRAPKFPLPADGGAATTRAVHFRPPLTCT